MKTTRHNDGLEWLREIRARLAKKFDYSPEKAAAYYRSVQKASAGKIYQRNESIGSELHVHGTLHDRANTETAKGRSATATSYRPARKNRAKRTK
jgi:hypothetical protein